MPDEVSSQELVDSRSDRGRGPRERHYDDTAPTHTQLLHHL